MALRGRELPCSRQIRAYSQAFGKAVMMLVTIARSRKRGCPGPELGSTAGRASNRSCWAATGMVQAEP